MNEEAEEDATEEEDEDDEEEDTDEDKDKDEDEGSIHAIFIADVTKTKTDQTFGSRWWPSDEEAGEAYGDATTSKT